MNAAPAEIVLGGVKYIARPLRDVDYAELEAWVQDQLIDITRRNCTNMPMAQQVAMMEKAIEKASAVKLTSPEGLRALASISGSIKMLWMSLRRDNPELTTDKVFELASDPAILREAMRQIEIMEARANPRPKSARREKRRRRRK
jgi:hypothetical protein